MNPHEDSALPVELHVLAMLRERVPRHEWDASRVIWAVRDYRSLIEIWPVATACADWLAGPEAQRVRDPHPQLRRYFDKERERCAPEVAPIRTLSAYSRSDVIAAPAAEQSRAL